MSTYNTPTDVTAATLARSTSVNDVDAATATAFGLLPTNEQINRDTTSYAVDTGTANAYLVALPKTATSYVDGMLVAFKPAYSCTGASTVNVDSLGVKSIKLASGDATATGNIIAAIPVEMRYSSTTGYFYLQGTSGVAGPAGSLSGTAIGVVDLLTGNAIASASTINLDTATGNRVHVTGTVTITAVTLTRGPRTVIFDDALTLTHHATNNKLPGGVNITTAAGDVAIYEGDGTTVRCVSYVKASGRPVIEVGDHEVVVHTGNGHGSSSTKIRLFTTTLTNVGTAITVAHSATLGTTFTINEAGLYNIHYSDVLSSGSTSFGVTVNSAELTTNVSSAAVASRLLLTTSAAASVFGAVSRTVRLAAGDVVRPHTDGTVDGTQNRTFFAIRKVVVQ